MTDQNNASIVSNGDQLNEGYFNDIIMFRKHITDTTAHSTTSTTFTTATTATFNTSTSSAILVGMHLKCDLKTDQAGSNAEVVVQLEGTNTGKWYWVNSGYGGSDEFYGSIVTDDAAAVGDALLVTESEAGADLLIGDSVSPCLFLQDDTVTVTILIRGQNGDTCTVDESVLDLIWHRGFIDV